MASLTKVRRIISHEELKKAFAIRLRVFVEEQGVPKEIELDEDDKKATHFLADVHGKAVGTARLVVQRGQAKIGRMAVLKSYRGRGVGKELLTRAVGLARKNGAKVIFLHAQVPVISFYKKMGFRCVGPVFVEGGIPHRKMVLMQEKKGALR
ncbi:MAG: GNAT family N-acetyltransferase [Candidatus Binatia bacterium]